MVNPKKIVEQSNLIPELEKMKTEMITLDYPKSGFLTPKTSKLGGIGYLPKSEPYPTNPQGQPLSLLAQISFDELPYIENYPTTGILSFYIDCFDDILGLNFNLEKKTEQSHFRVLYFENTDEPYHNTTEIEALFKPYNSDDMEIVIEEEVKITGSLATDPFPFETIDFKRYFNSDFFEYMNVKFGDQAEDVMSYLFDYLSPGGTHIGGYPFFTQEDPRTIESPYTKLLFQLDSDLGYASLGDNGVAQFMISEDDLKQKNFSNVLYNWDCY
ncbi:DUF1963 domain-containing protein [Weissella viridescens]|uniref:YwqG family protein n=1 Tax=Weissella viridescens TaxID=1629 RepID=UPI001D065A91|nr:DUF1963 domain-containing protein [Weissella viridescens]MCB6840506.1 DUF1963 domain-containing protein [Weissella viridescens]MCB6847239.1 DUF1963 domain-containing protein [Weissella viridescens]